MNFQAFLPISFHIVESNKRKLRLSRHFQGKYIGPNEIIFKFQCVFYVDAKRLLRVKSANYKHTSLFNLMSMQHID